MPTLFLLRHAKSSRDDPDLDDFDRPLAPRGCKAAPRMGVEMAARGWMPDMALVSPAVRTSQTWTLVSGALTREQAPDTRFEEGLYMAPCASILSHVCALPESVSSVLVVGHNPGLHECALTLAGPHSDTAALQSVEAKFPTAALARFDIEDDWIALLPGRARLTHVVRPGDLG